MRFLLKCCFCVLATLHWTQAVAVTINANTVSSVSGTNNYPKVSGQTTIIITLQPYNAGNPGTVESQNTNYDCPVNLFTVNEFKAFVPTTEGEILGSFVNKGSCKRVSSDFTTHSSFSVRWNLTNNTLQTQTLELYVIWIWSGGNKSNPSINYITIPANSTCSATVNNVELGTIKTGETKYSSLSASLSGTASSKSLTFTSSDMTSDGILQLGGARSKVKVYPTNSTNKSGSKWKMPPANTLPLTVDVTSGVRGGWNSSLLVTLECS